MKPKAIIKMTTDLMMTLLLLFLMGYHLWGDTLHEWAGAVMLALFILHHLLNLGWYKSIFKGKYTIRRAAGLIINTLLLISMAMLMYSGIVMSNHVFSFLPIEGGMALARQLHILGSHWGLVLMSLHLGMHWGLVLAMVKKRLPWGKLSIIPTVAGAAVAAYGLFVFFKRDLLTYLLLQTEFVFLDYAESKVLFYIDYIALMGLFVFVSYILGKLGQRRKKGQQNSGN